MGSFKGSKKPQNGQKKGSAEKLARVQDNPFERQSITKKKHDVFNRKVKGARRNVAMARSQAVEKRTNSLLVDYKRSKKANAFDDRRFGEADVNLTVEDKMWARIKKEASNRSRKAAGMYSLEDGGEAGDDDDEDGGGDLLLTHKGKALGAEASYDNGLDRSDDDDDDGGLDKEVVDRLHFGGGAGAAGRGAGGGANGRDRGVASGWEEKSRKEILEEIIAKSKKGKAEKAREKEEQEETRDVMDEGFGELMGLLKQRPQGRDAREKRGELDDYDRMMREFVFEAKGKATDRTKTKEEVAKAEKERLDALEAKRQRRMNGEVVDDDEDGGTGGKAGRAGKAGKQKAGAAAAGVRRDGPRNDDELDGGAGYVDARGIMWGSKEEAQGGSRGGGGDDGGGDSESDEDGDIGIDKDDTDDGDDDDGGDGDDGDDGGGGDGDDDDGDNDDEDDWDDVEEQLAKLESKADRGAGKGKEGKRAARGQADAEIPYVLECPQSMTDLLEVLTQYAKSADDINTVIDRVIKYHSVLLDSRNKERMHNFYDVLLKRVVRVGDQAAEMPAGGPLDRAKQLEGLTVSLYTMTQEMPDAATSLWHRTLGGMQRKLAKALRDYSESGGAEADRPQQHHAQKGGGEGEQSQDEGEGEGIRSCWPSMGHLLLLRLLGHLFPTTDFRHPIATPALLLLAQCVSQCPIRSCTDLNAALFCSGLLLQYTLPAGRLCPEAIGFLSSVLALYGPRGMQASCVVTPSLLTAPLGWLREAASKAGAGAGGSSTSTNLKSEGQAGEGKGGQKGKDSKGGEGGEEEQENEEAEEEEVGSVNGALDLRLAGEVDAGGDEDARVLFAAGVLSTTYRLLSAAAEGLEKRCLALPELFTTARGALRSLRPSAQPKLPLPLQMAHVECAKTLERAVSNTYTNSSSSSSTAPAVVGGAGTASRGRLPLAWQPAAVATIKALAPKFQETYTMRKDGDLDREKAKIKQMQRQVKHARKGAARELRRDAAFLETERSKEKEAAADERKRKWRENLTWLEQEQATWKQQVSQKSSRTLLKGGGTGIKKRPKVGKGY